ncbi:TPA: DUF6685 family protein [Pseudomonas aeruginosa]
MRDNFKTVTRLVLDAIGLPASFKQMLNESPKLRYSLAGGAKTIAADDVVRWHDWGKGGHMRAAGKLLGWRMIGTDYCSYTRTIEALVHLGYTKVYHGWECDIQDVTGLSASKSDLSSFSTLDEMATERVAYLTCAVTQENLNASLAWPEVRILQRGQRDDFLACHQWDGSVLLMNTGGSHHFVAGRYLAARLDVPVPLRADLHMHGISKGAVDAMVGEFEIFALADGDSVTWLRFTDSLRDYKAGYLWSPLPRFLEGGRAIFLPRTDARSMRVAQLLRETGHSDLGAHLVELAQREVPFLKQGIGNQLHAAQVE